MSYHSIMELLLIFVIGLLSAYLQGTIGFGAAVMMVNTLPFFMETGKAVALTQFTCIVFPIYIVIKDWRRVRWGVLIPILVPSLIFAFVGARLSISIDTNILFLILGAVFVLLSLYFLFASDKVALKPTKLTGSLIGVVCGLLGGMFAQGGPLAVLYLNPSIEERRDYVVTLQVYFLFLNTLSLLTRLLSSSVTVGDFGQMTVSTVGGIAGIVLSSLMPLKMERSLLKKVIYSFVGINGIIMIILAVI